MLDWDVGDLGGLGVKQFPSLHPPPHLSKEPFAAGAVRGCFGGAAEQGCVGGHAPGAWSRKHSLCLLGMEKKEDFAVTPERFWTAVPCSHSLFSKASALAPGTSAAAPAARSPLSLSSDLAQGHLQLGHLGRDFRADTSPISPSEVEGQSPMAVRYRNNNQRRFSMEASTAAGWAGQRGRGKYRLSPACWLEEPVFDSWGPGSLRHEP